MKKSFEDELIALPCEKCQHKDECAFKEWSDKRCEYYEPIEVD